MMHDNANIFVHLTVRSVVNVWPPSEKLCRGRRICNRASLNVSNGFLSAKKKEQAEDTSRHAPLTLAACQMYSPECLHKR